MSATHAEKEERFYADLPDVLDFHDVADPNIYQRFPESWWIALTDVRGSTRAIEAGRYRDVNALGVASIICVQNALKGVAVPYVFGGDGATLVVPGSRREAAEQALRGVKWLASEAFDLELRSGLVPLRELEERGAVARVAAFRQSSDVRLAMFSGEAFSLAEKWVKDPAAASRFEVSASGARLTDFEGFECRWHPLPVERGTMVSLLVQATAKTEQERGETYRRVLDFLANLVSLQAARPVHPQGMRLRRFFDDFSVEGRIRGAGSSGPAVRAARLNARNKTVIARVLGVLNRSAGGYDPRRYKAQLVENSDFRKFDEMLRMVLDLTPDELSHLQRFLEEQHAARALVFGIHQSGAALMTCHIRSYDGDHVHFIDGADGGYALAAKALKAQLKSLASEVPSGNARLP